MTRRKTWSCCKARSSTLRGTNETDDEHLYFIRWYVLKDSLNTNAHRGEIWLFDPELQRIGTWDLAQLPCVEHNQLGRQW